MLLDTHTHRPAPYPEGIISLSPADPAPTVGLYSVGIHPWDIPADAEPMLEQLRSRVTSEPRLAAIGETGLDSLRGAPMHRQIQLFKAQAAIAEEAGLPLIIHNVRCTQEITQLRRQWGATAPWIIHGFRGKASLLDMLLKAGCYISVGPDFNATTLPLIPADRLLVETDASPTPITEVVERVAAVLGADPATLAEQLSTNLQSLTQK